MTRGVGLDYFLGGLFQEMVILPQGWATPKHTHSPSPPPAVYWRLSHTYTSAFCTKVAKTKPGTLFSSDVLQVCAAVAVTCTHSNVMVYSVQVFQILIQLSFCVKCKQDLRWYAFSLFTGGTEGAYRHLFTHTHIHQIYGLPFELISNLRPHYNTLTFS